MSDICCDYSPRIYPVCRLILIFLKAYWSSVSWETLNYSCIMNIISSSRNFIIFGCTFRSGIHFELLFVHGVRLGSDSLFFSQLSNCSSTICLKAIPLPIALFWCLCQKSNDCRSIYRFCAVLALCLSLGQCYVIPIMVKSWSEVVFKLFSLVQDGLGCSRSFVFPWHLRTSLSISTPKPAGIMIGIYRPIWEEFLS